MAPGAEAPAGKTATLNFLTAAPTVAYLTGVGAGSATITVNEANIVAQRLDTGERKILIRGATFPHYVSTGHLIFLSAGALMAVPLDLTPGDVTVRVRTRTRLEEPSVLAKMAIMGSKDLVFSLHRDPENNFTGEQANAGYWGTLKNLAVANGAHLTASFSVMSTGKSLPNWKSSAV